VENEIEQHYARSLPVAETARAEVVLAYELNGVPLPPQHGYPLRLVVPGWYGMTNVKWLDRITVLSEPYAGYQQAQAYRFRLDADDEGTPLTRMAPRSLMVPPGIPDFMTRQRVLPAGTCVVTGRAWSGWGPIVGVELSLDGGSTWAPAKLEEADLGEWAWHAWSFLWQPEQAGTYELACRATDAAGNTQPLEPTWNVGGYSNNAVHRVTVTVTG
jgi:DMSO/TMAO reductase YedYZ molybdopterin-dependent catalytic subunit